MLLGSLGHVHIDFFGEKDSARERAPEKFFLEVIILFDFTFVLACTGDGEHLTGKCDVDGVGLDARNERLYDDCVLCLVHIDGELAARVNDLLLPIVKGVGSERAYEMLAQSLQVFGGSGYLQDYPVEQYIRDAKIDTLYEGTTAIQGLDFFFRKMVRDKFHAITWLGEQIQATATAAPDGDVLKADRKLLGKALSDMQAMITTLGFWAQAAYQGDEEQIYKVGLNTTRLLLAAGDLIIGWLLLRQAEVAKAALDGNVAAKDVPFYEGKIAAAQWFARNRLPLLSAEKWICEHSDDDVMKLPVEAF